MQLSHHRDPAPEGHWCLSEVAVFRDLSQGEMEVIGSQAPAHSVRAGQIVHSPATRAQTLYIVKRGRVRLFRVAEDGRTITTAIAGPGTIFGEMRVLGLRMNGTWAEALGTGMLCLMSGADVRRLLLSDPRIATRIVEQLGERLADCEQRLTDVMSKNVTERTAATLCKIADPAGDGQPAPIKLTHEQLARLTGTTRERTTKALGELADMGLVRLRRGSVVVLDLDDLRRLQH
ncbi:Crp/Fnr family transcriptional regulator [Nocardiopsis rhodophaea]|uniref:Crp/Fnr family transcriptional regulator n=1 Tax=Nocardiopsis rhodophaea TaxID=280238 RepID=A0ABP5ETB9_9ACTN